MRITRMTASNWRNFKSLDFPVRDRLFIVGPNASGKSNLLDLFRFLGDIAESGGGLAAAVDRRRGLGKVRSLFARNYQKGRLVVDLQLADGDGHGDTTCPSRAKAPARIAPSWTESASNATVRSSLIDPIKRIELTPNG